MIMIIMSYLLEKKNMVRYYSIIKFGRKRESPGNRDTNINTNRLTAKKGSPALLTFPIGVLPILEATNRQTPTGGVVNPMIKFNTAITVKWMGSTSTSMATLSSMGNNINSAAMVSIKVPTRMSRRLINSRTPYLLVVNSSICSEMRCGICSVIKIKPNKLAKPTRIISEDVVFMESIITTKVFLRLSFL